MSTPALTLIIAVYNKPKNLQFIFAALNRQSFKNFDVIIADDGSGNEIADVVNTAKRSVPFYIKHLWHADKGWRKNTMLNYAIQEASAEYVVFIDGDCLPSKHFLLDHFTHREKNTLLIGKRVEHGKRWADTLSIEKISSGEFERYSIADLFDALKGSSLRLEDGIRVSNPFLRALTTSAGVLGCNLSIYKAHLIDVNGFDEGYDGPGIGEDTDIAYRLSLIDVKGKSIRNLAIQYHIWHTITEVSDKNRRRFEQTLKRTDPKCIHGIKNI